MNVRASCSIVVLVGLAALSTPGRASDPPPTPPSALAPWVDYALARYGDGADCPADEDGTAGCVRFARLELRGHADRGAVTVLVQGINLRPSDRRPSRYDAAPLLGPANVFSVEAERFSAGRGALVLRDNRWWVHVAPGPFSLEVSLRFEAAPSLPLDVPARVGAVVDSLDGGALAYDASSDQHGGVVFLTSTAEGSEKSDEVIIRASRAFVHGSVTSFTYRFTVRGLREQRRLTLPRLGGESFERAEPDLSYSVTDAGIEVALSPGTDSVSFFGHFSPPPQRLEKPAPLPFEQWLFENDPRYPVVVATDGVEIDPAEVTGLDPGGRARGYFLSGSQALSLTPVAVTVDAGRRGAGNATLRFWQGHADAWLGALTLTPTATPETDRILLPTPTPAHYAEVGGEAVRMFQDNDTLSLRVVSPEGGLAPVQVQWRESKNTNTLFAPLSLSVPGQALQLDRVDVDVRLRPGFVPIVLFGGDNSEGDLLDGLHIYGLLLGLLGLALCRGARFPHWATAVAFILLAGLYNVEEFPRGSLIASLAAAAILARLPDDLLGKLRQQKLPHTLIAASLATLLVIVTAFATGYAKDRVHGALHPWAAAESDEGFAAAGFAGLPAPAGGLEEQTMDGTGDDQGGSEGDVAELMKQQAPQQQQMINKRGKLEQPLPSLARKLDGSLSGYSYFERNAKVRPVEKAVRPVPLERPSLPSGALSYRFESVLPGAALEATALLAGPSLRALWMFAECVGLWALLVLVLARARRFWPDVDVAHRRARANHPRTEEVGP